MNFSYEKYKNEVLSDKKIKKLITKHHLSEQQIEDGLAILSQIYEEEKTNQNSDYTSEIEVHKNGLITKVLVSSKQKTQELLIVKNHKLKEISLLKENARFKIKGESVSGNSKNWEICEINSYNLPLFEHIHKQLKNFSKTNKFEGFYVSGFSKYNCSSFFSALANRFLELKKSIAYFNIVSLYDLSRVDSTFGYESIKQILSDVDFVFLDGGLDEKVPEWFLTNVVNSIFLNRANAGKPVIFSSDLSKAKLRKHLSEIYKNNLTGFQIKLLMEKIDLIAPAEFILKY